MSESFLTVSIKNWSKYNPRNDIKKPSWFALDNCLVEDSDFYSFGHGEFKAWVYILSQASRKKSAVVFVNLDHAERVSNISKKDFLNSIKKLESLQAITVSRTDHVQIRTRSVHDPYATLQDITLHNTTEQNSNAHSVSKFDFESVYKIYPRKLGKAKGLKVLEKVISTQQDFDEFVRAVSNYAQDCHLNGTSETYIKHFSSFVGTKENQTWREYVDFKPIARAQSKTTPKESYNNDALAQALRNREAKS